MAPSAVSIPDGSVLETIRPRKRVKLNQDASDYSYDASVAIPPHPLGVKPAGNAYTSFTNLKDHAGAFTALPDELLMSLLEWLHPSELIRLGATSKVLYAFARAEELWRSAFVE